MWLIQASVRSTIQRLGSTRKRCNSSRLNLEFPGAGLGDGSRGLRTLVRGISEDTLDEGEEPARAPIEDEQSAVAILHSSRVDDDVQQQAERVDQDMPFAAGDLLGRIKALRVKRGAPF